VHVVIEAPLVDERPTGSAIHLVQLVRALRELRPEMRLTSVHSGIHRGDAHLASSDRINAGVAPVTVPVPTTLLRAVESWLQVPRRRWFTGPFDVYHQFHTDALPAAPSRKLLVTVHDTVQIRWPQAEGRLHRNARRVVRRASGVVTVSNFSREELVSAYGIDQKRVHVIHNGVDTNRFTPEVSANVRERVRRRLGLTRPYFLYLGGFTPRKNLPRLLEAYAASGTKSFLDLVIAGPAGMPLSPVASLAAELGIQREVRQLGYVDDRDIPILYASASALAYPSLYEGFGLPVLEAYASGVPVLTSNTTALPEVAGPYATLVDPTDVSQIAAGLTAVLDDSVDAREGRLAHARGFSWTEVARRLLDLYEAMVG